MKNHTNLRYDGKTKNKRQNFQLHPDQEFERREKDAKAVMPSSICSIYLVFLVLFPYILFYGYLQHLLPTLTLIIGVNMYVVLNLSSLVIQVFIFVLQDFYSIRVFHYN